MSYRCAAWGLRLLFRLTYRLDVVGRERIPATGSLVLASNHQSNLDPPLIGAFFPREISFVAKKQLFANPLFGRLIRHFNAIPLDRSGVDLRALKEIRARLAAGRDMLVFPEGTRSRDGSLGKPRAGLGLIVSATGADVLPVLILGSRNRPGLPGFRPRLRLEFGSPIPFACLPTEGAAGGRAEAVTLAVFRHVEDLFEQSTRDHR